MANQTGNGRNVSSDDDDDRERMYRDRDRDERFMQRDRERMGSWDDRSSRSWDRDEDRSVGWRSIDRGGMGQSGYGSGREGDRSYDSRSSGYPRSWDDRARERGVDERFAVGRGHGGEGGNYLGQGGQQMGNPWGNQMGHGSSTRDMGYGGGGNLHGSGWQSGNQGFGYDQNQRGMGHDHNYTAGYGGYGQQGYAPSYQGGMHMGQPGMSGNYNAGQPYGGLPFRHQHHHQQSYSPSTYVGPNDTGIDYSQMGRTYGTDYSHMGWSGDRDRNEYDRDRHESLGQRIKHWLQGHRGKGPQGYQRSDERIREHVCEMLTHDDRVDATNIEVAVKNGEVTLSGTVNDRATKRLAEECIEDISGVKDVQNNIRVIAREIGRTSPTGIGTGSSMETPSSTPGNGTDKRHRA